LLPKYALFDDTDAGCISNLCEQLCDTRLLRVVGNDHFDPSDSSMNFRIDVQLDDVECALEETLLNGKGGAFYSRLINFARPREGNPTEYAETIRKLPASRSRNVIDPFARVAAPAARPIKRVSRPVGSLPEKRSSSRVVRASSSDGDSVLSVPDAEVQEKEDTARAVRPRTLPNSSVESVRVNHASANEFDAEIQDKFSEFTDLVQTKLAAAKVEKDKSFSTIRGLENRIDGMKRKSEEVEFHYELQLLEAKEKREDMKRKSEEVEFHHELHLLEAEEREEKIDSLTRRLAVSEKMKNDAQKQAKTELRKKNEAVGRLDTAHRTIAALRRQLDDATRERDETKVQMDEVIKKVECFDCLEHENDLCAFIPCGHLVCTGCKDKYAIDSPCPKCESNIMGRLRLYN
jgi:hypothetical protein